MEKIRIGVFGGGARGQQLASAFLLHRCEIVAVCEKRESEVEAMRRLAGGELTAYSDFEEFLGHDMDVVVLANYFHRHAPYAVRCLERGLHVYSECLANGTMAEGVALVRAQRASGGIYMLGEEFPEMLHNREIRKIAAAGILGKILYAEGEYNHPSNPKDTTFRKMFNYSPEHWRNYLPATYYITHSLGPIMAATGATPCRVTALTAAAPGEADDAVASRVSDRVAVIITQNDDGSLFRVTGCSSLGGYNHTTRVCGMKGQVENVRGLGEQVMVRFNPWNIPEGRPQVSLYTPEGDDPEEETIKKSGHGGADYLMVRTFLDCIRRGVQPPHPYDVHSAVTMSSVAILAHRSVLAGGAYFDVPDFRREEDCLRYENDFASPFPGDDGTPPTLPCNSDPTYAPSEEQMALYRKSLGE